jgi:hypothetical protein
LKALLSGIASELTATRDIPIDIVALCRELGVGLRVDLGDGSRRGALVQRGHGWEAVVMRRHARPAPLSGQERFTIAHELGHYLLLKHVNFRPQREAEYWLGEDLCNHFASRLLLPSSLLAGSAEPTSAVGLAAAVEDLATRALVTHEPAARALVGQLKTPVALGTFLLDPLASTRRLGFRGWWVENRSWWGGRGGRRLAVYADHALASVLETMRQIGRGQTATVAVPGAATTFLCRRTGRTASFAALLA